MQRSDVDLPRLGYGAANVGNLFRALSDDQVDEVLEAAWDCGIRYFDTAPHYGLGLSERRLGRFLQTKPRDEYVLSTKAGRLLRPNPDDRGGFDVDNDFHVRTDVRRRWDFGVDGIRASVAESLERMGLDRVDVLYLHDPDRSPTPAEALASGAEGIAALKAEGLVAAGGVGSMSTPLLEQAARSGDFDVLMIAGRLTLLEQPAAAEALPSCHDNGTGVVAASVFNSGLLAKAEPIREGRYEYGGVPDELWQRLQRIVAVCRNHDVRLPAAAIQFPMQDAATRSVVVGSSRAEQVRQNVELAAVPIPDAFWGELRTEGLIPG